MKFNVYRCPKCYRLFNAKDGFIEGLLRIKKSQTLYCPRCGRKIKFKNYEILSTFEKEVN